MQKSRVLHSEIHADPAVHYLCGTVYCQQASLDAEIDNAVERVLRDADLTTVTKREIRRQLEDQYGMDLSSRKQAINAAIDRVLLSRAG